MVDSDDFSVSVKVKSTNFSVHVEKKSSLSDIASTIDTIVNEILKSKSLTSVPKTPSPLPNLENIDVLASRLNVDEKKLEKAKIFVLKGKNFNIINPQKMKPSEVGLLILAINEFVLNNPFMSFDDWKDKFENNNLKGKLTSSEITRDYKKYQRIEKSSYDDDKNLVLSAKGLDDLKLAISKSI